MLALADLYPWDVEGDPAAADRIAGLGLAGVTLAAAYHAVRAVTPLHPRHRIVVRDSGVYYQPAMGRWSAAGLRPVTAEGAGSFERAAQLLRGAGLPVTAWLVLTHNGRLGSANPGVTVRNAYGDSYPWALCAGVPAVREYATALAAEVAALPETDAVELEACGWYGAGHGSAHDKTGLADPALEWLLSLCFCPDCQAAYAVAGGDAGEIRARVRSAVDQRLAGGGAEPGLPAEVAGVVDAARGTAAARFTAEVVAGVRAAAPGKRVYLHADPDPRATGANPGGDPAVLLGPGGADGIVLSCWDPARAPGMIGQSAMAAPPGREVAASLLAVRALGGDPASLPAQAAAAAAAGASELRLYHAGLAAPGDLAGIRAACRAVAAPPPPVR